MTVSRQSRVPPPTTYGRTRNPEELTRQELADFLGVDAERIKELIGSGRIRKYIDIDDWGDGRRREYFRRAEAMEFLRLTDHQEWARLSAQDQAERERRRF